MLNLFWPHPAQVHLHNDNRAWTYMATPVTHKAKEFTHAIGFLYVVGNRHKSRPRPL